MSLVDNGNGLSAADVAAVVDGGRSNGNYGWGDGSFWIIVLFLFALMGGNGWGNGFNGGGGEMQRGFDQQAVMNGVNGLTSAVSNGFANAEVSRCNAQTNILQSMNGIASSLQNCCCENRAGLADLKYTVATENCADRNALQQGVQAIIANQTANNQTILDKLCQLELDGIKQRNADLLAENNALKFAESQSSQTAQILANNAAQTQALEQYLNPAPIPAYVVQNPNCCQNTYGCGCNNVI